MISEKRNVSSHHHIEYAALRALQELDLDNNDNNNDDGEDMENFRRLSMNGNDDDDNNNASASRKNSISDKVRLDPRFSRRMHLLCIMTLSKLTKLCHCYASANWLVRPFLILTALAFMIYFLSSLNFKSAPIFDEKEIECGSSHETYNMTFNFKLKEFREYSISVDNEHCSQVGKDIIEKGGSAVDAAIASGLCNGLMNSQSAGIGGGHFMVIYLKSQNKSYAINAREKAPINAFETMFLNKSSLRGGLATAIPGEIAGFAAAHRLGGRLRWRDLFEPAIRMCMDGYPISSPLAQAIGQYESSIRNDPILAKTFLNPKTGHVLGVGDIVRRPLLGTTLRKLAEKGSEAFYDGGTLTQQIVNEINSNGGRVSVNDFLNYRADVSDALTMDLDENLKVLTVSIPSSGVLAAFIMKLMKKFNIDQSVLDKGEKEGLFYHRLIESFKHAYAHRSLLGDDNTAEIDMILNRLQDDKYIDEIRSKINDLHTFPSEYYTKIEPKEDHGTAHISILVDGDAVSLTSTINTYFGAKYSGKMTGIIYNNEMDDFSTPHHVNYFNLEPSEANFIRPGKRPMSSMSPLIVIDNRTGDSKLVLGASGGSKIITTVAQVAIKALWLDVNIKEAIDERRVHHQLYPPEVQVEDGFDMKLHRALLSYGHNVSCYEIGGSIVQAVHKIEKAKIFAYGDPRKGGIPAGA